MALETEHLQWAGIEKQLQLVEAWARPVAGSRTQAREKPLSEAAYGYWTCFLIDIVRGELGRPPTAERLRTIAELALRLGYKFREARARFNWGPLARTGLRRRASASRGGRAPRKPHADKVARILAAADATRKRHPPSRKHSARWLAAQLAKQTNIPYGTVRGILDANDKR